MIKVALIHQAEIQHYRVDIYNRLSAYLKDNNMQLEVISGGIENGNQRNDVRFNFIKIKLGFFALVTKINELSPEVIVFFVNLKNLYLFPFLFYAKFKGIKLVFWGHGINLKRKDSIFNVFYYLEHALSDAIILYAPQLKKFIKKKYHYKVFTANNTLNSNSYEKVNFINKNEVLKRYNINTSKNIICIGRMQKRKRINDLVSAFRLLNDKDKDVGLVLAGPDSDGILKQVKDENIYYVGEIYGLEKIALLKACDVFCLPGAVGLSIVDAFYCSLPLVTEDVPGHGPEIFYLVDGSNGFIVPLGDISILSQKLSLLLNDEMLRKSFARRAKEKISKYGDINVMCKGFKDALQFALNSRMRKIK